MTSYFNHSYSSHESPDLHQKKKEEPSTPEILQVIEAGSLDLFSYDNNDLTTKISISGKKLSYKKRVDYSVERGSSHQHHVQFLFCGVRLDDSYSALNSALSVIKVFEKHKFGAGAKSITVKMFGVKYEDLYAMCRLVNSSQGHELLEIGICQKNEEGDITFTQTMHIGYVYALQNALIKAMSWICPMQGSGHIKEN